ncbi:hypothetical protein DSL72_009469 [Monilinia vaccinii-corymbosi]|uniref:Uncharacterized protein n=1 Tax=Monilinia vaccinii-corymbosi TaxID=61207 RepID=A0A8A3PR97_9HELO|nr:hypothetical protein DSL72_009469 [Monilinia vaccinii-corymbosi]
MTSKADYDTSCREASEHIGPQRDYGYNNNDYTGIKESYTDYRDKGLPRTCA